MSKFVVWFVKITGFIPQLFLFRKKIYFENKKKQGRKIKGGAVLASNHHSIYDFALLMYVFGFNDMYCLVGEVMFKKTPILSWLLKRLGAIKVDRYNHDVSFMSHALDKLKKGKVVEVFPEGRLPLKHEKDFLPFKPGAVHLALKSGKPIIPVYHDGNYKKKIKVIIGEPIDLSLLYDDTKSEKENINDITQLLKEKIAYLRDKINEIEKKTK